MLKTLVRHLKIDQVSLEKIKFVSFVNFVEADEFNCKRGTVIIYDLPLQKLFSPKNNDGEIVKTENWGLLNLSYLIKKNKKGSYIHFKIKAVGKVIKELEKNESIDKKLLRYLTVKVKKFDLDANYFGTKEDSGKKESIKD